MKRSFTATALAAFTLAATSFGAAAQDKLTLQLKRVAQAQVAGYSSQRAFACAFG